MATQERGEREQHWDEMYGRKGETEVTWYQPRLDNSLALLQEAGLSTESRVIDVGAGSSTLVDSLLEQDITRLTALDLSRVALDHSRKRLGAAAQQVTWMVGDITTAELPAGGIDLWHDRAVFHFLTEPAQRRAYRDNMLRALSHAGRVVLCTFAEDGPERCSNLPTRRYGPDAMQAELGPELELARTFKEQHRTPWGGEQSFRYFLLRRAAI